MTGDTALLEVSAGCDADCVFCLRNQGRAAPPAAGVDLEALERFLRMARRLGLKRAAVGGDEPLVLGLEAVAGLARLARAQGFSEVSLFSNGIALGREGAALRLAAAGIGAFLLPLYGPDAETHDAVTQRPGSFQALNQALAALALMPGVRARLHTVRLRQNEERLDEIRALAQGWGLELDVLELQRRPGAAPYDALLPRVPAAARRTSGGRQPLELRYNVLRGRLDMAATPELVRFLKERSCRG